MRTLLAVVAIAVVAVATAWLSLALVVYIALAPLRWLAPLIGAP